VDWQLRHECRTPNTASGLHQFIVRDLRIVERKGQRRPYNINANNASIAATNEN
jgi:hypothetical protein